MASSGLGSGTSGAEGGVVTDRITYDLDADGFETERIDEIVMSSATVHLEMLSHASAYMTVKSGNQDDLMIRLHANPATRADRNRILRANQDRLADHLTSLLPWRWNPKHPRSCLWAIPVRKRPAAAVRDWWEARRHAGVELIVMEES